MIIASLLATVLAVPAAADKPAAACQTNAMTSDWGKITFGLFLTPYTIPESAPRTATLRFKGCKMDDASQEFRSYTSDDGVYRVVALTNANETDGATTLVLIYNGKGVRLGAWAHRKVFYKGVGIDNVAIPDGPVTNVFVLPEGAILPPR